MFKTNSNNKNGYTLTEILIAIAVIGAIALIIIPTLQKFMPNKENEMHKKMSYLVEQIAAQMYDNETFYPRTSDITKAGFQNTDAISVGGIEYGGTSDTDKKQKFCKLFARQFNKTGNAVSCPSSLDSTTPSFRSTDGVDWWIPQTTFTENNDEQTPGFVKIKIDVNGTNKGPNCASGQNNCRKPDTFYYYISTNGSVTLANPTIVSSGNFEINTSVTTVDKNGNPKNNQGGIVKIAIINPDNSYGTFSSSANSFKNLKVNTSYILRAEPNTGYTSNWPTKKTNVAAEKKYGYKTVRITKPKTNVKVEFREVQTYCIKLRISCSESNIQNCVNTKQYKYDCKYSQNDYGDYELVSSNLDNYKYVGQNNGSYSYGCSEAGNLTWDSSNYLKICGLESGDYQLYITPRAGLVIYPNNNEEYLQNVRLGNSDLSDFIVNIGQPIVSSNGSSSSEPDIESCDSNCYVEDCKWEKTTCSTVYIGYSQYEECTYKWVCSGFKNQNCSQSCYSKCDKRCYQYSYSPSTQKTTAFPTKSPKISSYKMNCAQSCYPTPH